MFTLKRIFPSLPETERGRSYHLRGDPKGKKLIYSIANSVIIRSVDNPAEAEIVTNHAKKVTSTCYTPSGFYVASGDASGNLKIWDTVNEEHAVKYEYPILTSSIYDIAWSDDSKRIVAVGDGREKYGAVISWDTGTTLGSVAGHVKAMLSVDYRKVRPFGIITASEDMAIIHHTGPPFKYDKTNREHNNFVNCVRYSHDGVYAASAGKEGRICIYDGKTLNLIHELNGGSPMAHEGGVYSISWSPCGKKLLSASGDRTCKIWNVPENKCETVFEMGSEVNDQQLGCLWMNEHIISVALSGKLSFLDPANPSIPKQVFWGHNKGIISVALSDNKESLLTGSYSGTLNHWTISSGVCTPFKGNKFPNQISSIAIKDDQILVAGIGKLARFGSISKLEVENEEVKLDSEPLCAKYIDCDNCVVGCLDSVNLISKKSLVHTVPLPYQVVSVVSYGSDNKVAVCGSDNKIRFYKVVDMKLELIPDCEITINSGISQIYLSHDGKHFIIAAASKNVYIYDIETMKETASWAAHANRVNCATFSPDDKYVATCGIDGSVNVWKCDDRNYRIELRLAHRTYNCVAVHWIDSSTIVSVGQQDCTIKFWELKL